MRGTSPLDLIEGLKSRFDDVSVKAALQLIETPGASPYISWVVQCLLGGRGGKDFWPRIESYLVLNPSAQNLAILANHLPAKKIHELALQANIDDQTFLTLVKAGRIPPFRILPDDAQQKLFNSLREVISHEADAEVVFHVIFFLLEFDTEPGTYGVVRQESISLAVNWCLTCPDKERVKAGLSQVLRKTSNPELLRMAADCLHSCEWNHEDTFLLIALMQATRSRRYNSLVRHYLNNSEPLHHAYLVSVWIETTQCCREALSWGKEIVRSRHRRSKLVLASLCQFSQRKSVARWLVRYFRAQLRSQKRVPFPDNILRDHPTKRNLSFARQHFDFVDSESQARLLPGLIKHSHDNYFVDLAKQHILDHPDSENSFKLMCRIAARDPGLAIPWLAEWIERALPEQVLIGLAVIIEVAPTAKYIGKARNLLSQLTGSPLSVYEADLLYSMLKAAPSSALVEQAEVLLSTSSALSKRKLARILRRKTKE